MSYTTIYLQYKEQRISNASQDGYDDYDDDDIDDGDGDLEGQSSTFVEFTPVRISVNEPRGKSVELALDFEASLGDTLHIVVVRYNSSQEGVVDDWCVERILQVEDEADDLVERIEDSLVAGECIETIDRNAVVTRAETFSFQLGT